MTNENTAAIKSNYGAVATSGLSSEHAGVKAIAEAFGYSAAELSSIPAGANMGLSCGNPTATANLRAGEVVVDLGCGGGLDVFLAAAKVGPTGKAIGIDMTQQMIDLANKNAAGSNPPLTNVEFHLATIDAMPLDDNSVDCVISNCVINLADDKGAVFQEIARVLKSGGRVAVSDIALKKPLPEELAGDISALVGCIGGAIPIADYRQGLLDAGFAAVEVVDDQADLNAYASVDNQAGCCSPTMSDDPLAIIDAGCCGGNEAPLEPGIHQRLTELLKKYDINEYAASVKVYAVKP
ncbi:methyltransferase domain-containing protein [Blastopirellula marina]|uniref:Arsenite methyltransferase n=1 Tax=Blastopirellula marina DSM 3645 TaxID=314230 RepID=A3ZS19_9BACT|nr:methyltransferase domain-containing protein [Blastopirellula marina]EAQ80942.1 SAM-dependent methyltransferase UbiE/COQ5 family protein [Blastopirellula marina DSM 3645]